MPSSTNLRGLFGGGGSSIWRWVAIVFGLWLVFSTFVLVTEQERGVVLRFGQFARILQPGPHFKAPWPIETVTKVNADAEQRLQRQRPGVHPRRQHGERRDQRAVPHRRSAAVPVRYARCRQRAAAGRAECGARAGRPFRSRHRAQCPQRADRRRARPPAEGPAGLPHRPGRHRVQPAQRAPAG